MKYFLFSKVGLVMLVIWLGACKESKPVTPMPEKPVPDSFFRLSQVNGRGYITAFSDTTYQEANPLVSYSKVEPIFDGENKNGMKFSVFDNRLTIPFKTGQSYSILGKTGIWDKDTTITFWLEPRYLVIVDNVRYQVNYSKLLEFKANKNQDGSYTIAFKTGREVDVRSYFLQASQDGATWSDAMVIYASLNELNETNTYSYTYPSPVKD